MFRKKWLWLLIAIVVAAIAVVAVLGMRGRGNDRLEVQVAPVQRMRVVQTVTATGRIQPVTQVNISADVSGKITRLEVEEGDWVEKGQLLLELEREQYQAAMENAEASLRVSQSAVEESRENLTRAEKDYERVKRLFEEDLDTQATLDGAWADFQAGRARYQSTLDQVEQQRAAVKQARDALSKTTIYAPMAGTVSKLNKEVGEIAVGSQFQSDVILVLSNLNGMEALVDVDENDIVRVALGDAGTIEVDALPEVKLGGEVTEIANTAKVSGTGTTDQKTEFEVKIGVQDPNKNLRPGMTASADIVTDVRDDALAVPIQSVAVRTPEQLAAESGADEGAAVDRPEWTPDRDGFVQVVFVVDGERARARQVTTGIQSDTHIEILDGLSEGDEVVVGNYRAISRDLRDGSQVVAVKAGGPGGDGEPIQARR